MALTSYERWNLLREVIQRKKSGTLVIQLGQKYLFWALRESGVLWVSASHQDFSLTASLLANKLLAPEALHEAAAAVTDSRSLGAALLKLGLADEERIRSWTEQHALWLCPYLLQSSAHLYWTERVTDGKKEFVHHAGIPLYRILLACDRSSVDVRSAFQIPEEMPEPYAVDDAESLSQLLAGAERRMLPYLRRGESVDVMYADPELDRLTVCRALFLLWISARIRAIPLRARPEPAPSAESFLRKMRAVPPDWFIPFAIGILLGILLSPGSPPAQQEPAPRSQSLKHALQAPAWRPDP